MKRCGVLRHILGSPDLALQIKLRLYEVTVCSVLVYGCESWQLTDKAMRHLNGTNSKMLSFFTGKTISQEARPTTTSFNLIHKIRIRRHKWLGHIIRAGPDRLIYQAVEAQRQLGTPGGLCMDAPLDGPISGLTSLTADRAGWRDMQKDISRTNVNNRPKPKNLPQETESLPLPKSNFPGY